MPLDSKIVSKENARSTLLNIHRKEYGSNYDKHILEIYIHHSELVNQLSSRRQRVNSFFLTINTGAMGLFAYSLIHGVEPNAKDYLYLIAITGIIVNFAWCMLLYHYKNVSAAKYTVLHLIEEKLPLRPYDAEWDLLERGDKIKKYIPFSYLEGLVPRAFIILYLVICYVGAK